MTPANVLIVDDDPASRDTVEALLIPEGHHHFLAGDGESAYRYLAEVAVDLVICDAVMRQVSGFEVCQAMKRHPTWQRIPVIMLTGLDRREDMVRALDAGADDVVVKPAEGSILRARSRAMLRIRAQYRQLPTTPDGDALLAERRARLIEAAGLTAREREVLDLVLLGRNHQEIALALAIGERTSKFHLANLLKKLGADSRNDLTRLFL